jgi:hypothetical protein
MIPLLSQDDLDGNPAFSKLWEHIITAHLESDGSTRRKDVSRIQDWQNARNLRLPGTAGSLPQARPSESPSAVDLHPDHGGSLLDKLDSLELHDDPDDCANEQKAKPLPPSFEVHLRALRVARMRRRILKDVLGEVAYLPNGSSDDGEESEAVRSRIPVASTTSPDVLDHGESTGSFPSHGQDDFQAIIAKPQGGRSTTPDLGILRDTILITSNYIDALAEGKSFSQQEHNLLADDIAHFKQNISTIATTVSNHLTATETSLLNLCNVPPPDPSPAALLSESVTAHQEHQNSLATKISSAMTTLHQIFSHLTTLQNTLLSLTLQSLEVSKHGILARHRASKLKFLTSFVEAMELKTRVLVLEARVRTETHPDTVARKEGVKTELRKLEEDTRRVEERRKLLEDVLGEYERLTVDEVRSDGGVRNAGLEVMRTLGKRYGEIEKEMLSVKDDIERLDKQTEGQ